MRLSTILLAVLPAIAAAQSDASPSLTTVTSTSKTTITTTTTDTAHLTKTVTLSRVHTVVSINSTGVILPTGGTVTLPSSTAPASTAAPTTLPTKGPSNAGVALDAGRVALAGVAGMVVAALL
ncbi:hypothetical protein ISF_05717 [Cordyceps fumosorosea ARSEF 2679]|uniref:Uncharacterized protein n=1 Tax=Cordyceps fumosorosea (strain ARSEF 2679) TaxID=1081104 RepID=A0A167TJZ4_CORFA|nr:hypothetical protein ISF_05717 [Cordyceps fumosorosea ARSEF 2679]OAA60678.1 hypothetical protein ISF_05717 [Cordyceps fumosorosea ARSEF 2679]